MNLSDIMDALADVTFTGIPATSRFAWPQQSVVPPAWIVSYPEEIEYDIVYGEGADKATFPCFYVVGQVDQKSSRDALSDVIDGAGAIKADIEADATLTGGQSAVADSVRVVSCQPETITLGGVVLLAARFDIEVIA